jgi:hypothetical protein
MPAAAGYKRTTKKHVDSAVPVFMNFFSSLKTEEKSSLFIFLNFISSLFSNCEDFIPPPFFSNPLSPLPALRFHWSLNEAGVA